MKPNLFNSDLDLLGPKITTLNFAPICLILIFSRPAGFNPSYLILARNVRCSKSLSVVKAPLLKQKYQQKCVSTVLDKSRREDLILSLILWLNLAWKKSKWQTLHLTTSQHITCPYLFKTYQAHGDFMTTDALKRQAYLRKPIQLESPWKILYCVRIVRFP